MQLRQFIQISFLILLGTLVGCASNSEPSTPKSYEIFSDSYGALKDGSYKLPAIPVKRINEKYHRQIVKFYSSYPKGTVIVNTPQRYLYYVLGGGKAVRYGISVGREGFAWEGEAYIAVKRAWPKWFPPEEMADRQPHLRKYVKKGMNPGLRNPLGARALYLHDGKTRQDTLFRLHGTPQWRSIGTAASSGCIRLINQDIIDLYDRIKPGRFAKVIVIQ